MNMTAELLNSNKVKETINEIIDRYSRIPYYDDSLEDYLYFTNSEVDEDIKEHSAEKES